MSEIPIKKELMSRAPNLKILALGAVGVGNFDIDHTTDRGILVINTLGRIPIQLLN